VAALFAESLEEVGGKSAASSSLPSWGRETVEAKQAKRRAEEMLAVDPTVFQYDEVIDDIKAESGLENTSSQIHADGLTQKKRVGLVVRAGSDAVATGNKRAAKYTEKVMVAVDRRRVEQQMVEDRALKKEKNARKDAEVFVTPGFVEELKRRKKFEDELEAQEAKDEARAAEKQENGAGFANMYRNLLNGGLATSRGGEKIKEQAPAYENLDAKEEKLEALAKLEAKEEVKEEVAKDEPGEDGDDKREFGVLDAAEQAAAEESAEDAAKRRKREKEQQQQAEQEQRQEKALSAKERYLARKRAAAQAE